MLGISGVLFCIATFGSVKVEANLHRLSHYPFVQLSLHVVVVVEMRFPEMVFSKCTLWLLLICYRHLVRVCNDEFKPVNIWISIALLLSIHFEWWRGHCPCVFAFGGSIELQACPLRH